MDVKRSAYIAAGSLAGLVSLLVFLLIHHLTIDPIWFLLPFGLLLGAGGGATVGWAFFAMRPQLFSNAIFSALALAGLLALTRCRGCKSVRDSGRLLMFRPRIFCRVLQQS
jgi:hypothetical protein